MFGGDLKNREYMVCACVLLCIFALVVIVVFLVDLLLRAVGMEPMSLINTYPADQRIGVLANDLTERTITNMQQERRRAGECPAVCEVDMSKWMPGVDRPALSRLQCDKAMRSDELNTCLNKHKESMTNATANVSPAPSCISGRDQADFVLQQFGNDGTVIDPKTNPLFNPMPPKKVASMCR